MHKLKKYKAIIMLLALMLAVGVTVPSTLAYLQAETETVKNTFVPVKSIVHDLEISVTGEKVLTGRDWQEGDSFVFPLQQWNDEKQEWETKGNGSVSYSSESDDYSSFDMSSQVKELLTEPGTYKFRILEGEGSIENVTYDDTVCLFDIEVTADDTGAMDITKVTDQGNAAVTLDEETGNFTVAVKFTNIYEAPEEPPVIPDPADLKLDFRIVKTVKNTGDKEIGPAGFKFQLEKNSTGETWNKTSDADGNAAFHMTFDKDDIGKVYIYELTEIDDGREGVTYDSAEYEVKVGIELDEESNKLIPSITLDGKQVGKVEVGFKNTYDSEQVPSEPSQPTDPSSPTDTDEPSAGPDQPEEPTDKPDDGTTDGSAPQDGLDEPADKDKGTQTGDDFNMLPPLALLLISAAIAAAAVVTRRKRTN